MAIKVASDHPTLLLIPKIQEISNAFLDTYGFNYFQYLRCYDNGSIGLLTNNSGFIEQFQHADNTPVVFSSFENEHKNSASFWFLWNDELPEMPVQFARDKLGLHNGITLVKRSKNYYDMIAVALPYDPPNSGAFYLNKLKAIEQFVNEFDIANKSLIALMDKNPICLPEPYRDTNYKDLCLTQGKIPVRGVSGKTYITAQELACIRWLIQGMSHKHIANMLNISPRTVETYLQRVKHRTGFSSTAEIERMISAFCP